MRDSYGLFDYETVEFKQSKCFISDNRIIIREKHDIKCLSQEFYDNKGRENPQDSVSELGNVIFDRQNNKIFLSSEVGTNLKVNNKTLQELQDKIWHVIKPKHAIVNTSELSSKKDNEQETRFLSNFEYILKKNDIIKLGRIKYLVKDINIVNHNVQESKETFNLHYETE